MEGSTEVQNAITIIVQLKLNFVLSRKKVCQS